MCAPSSGASTSAHRLTPGACVARRARKPEISYPESLPVSEKRDEIARAVSDNQVVIVCGETGSGKTTQLRSLRRHDAHHWVYRRSGGDQGDPCAPGGQSTPGARSAAATRAGAACAGGELKHFTQRCQFNRMFP
jgi:hypothetical protein